MLTEAKIEANKANAQSSTGPRTEEGKAASSLNAVRHGLTAKTLLLPGEDPAAYDALASGMLHDLNPLNTIESDMATKLIDISWRLQRPSRFEGRILAADSPDYKAFAAMGQHAVRLHRQFLSLMTEYRQIHAQNSKKLVEQLEKAEIVNAADIVLSRPDTLPKHGFDFSLEYLQRWMERRIAFREAQTIVKDYQNGEYDEVFDEEEAA